MDVTRDIFKLHISFRDNTPKHLIIKSVELENCSAERSLKKGEELGWQDTLIFRRQDPLRASFVVVRFKDPFIAPISEMVDPAGDLERAKLVGRTERLERALQQLETQCSRVGVPVRTIVAFWGKDVPQSWLFCNGASIPDKKEYSQLRMMVGPNTPDLRGYFLRGLDSNGKVDPDGRNRGVGNIQQDMIKRHSHPNRLYFVPPGQDGRILTTPHGENYNVAAYYTYRNPEAYYNCGPVGGAETRPKNIAVNWIIKF